MKSPRNRAWPQSEVGAGEEQDVHERGEPRSTPRCPQDPKSPRPLVPSFGALAALDKNQAVNDSDGPAGAGSAVSSWEQRRTEQPRRDAEDICAEP